MLSKLSEHPVKDSKMRNMLTKDYFEFEHPIYERAMDRDEIKELLYNNINSYSRMINSVMLYKADTYELMGVTPDDSLSMSYNPSKEEWFKKIESYKGGCAIVGIHKELQISPKGNYVISVGRVINSTDLSGKSLGYIIINVKVNDLEKLWADAKLTNNSRFYLIDESGLVIFSKDASHINKSIDDIFGEKIKFKDSSYIVKDLGGRENYIISSKSKLSGWTVVTVIPKDELFSYLNNMFYITFLIGAIVSIFSVAIAVLIATGVTRPLYKLNQKMKLVGIGNFDVEIGEANGEIGEISNTVRKMILEIKMLIEKIYKEEEEKRNAEMNALQAQINPHFLYNTLNTIKWMASMQGAKSIESALGSLSSLYSFVAKSNADFIPIRAEIMFIQEYLTLLNLRYFNRFTVSYDIDEEVYDYKTLKFLIQPVIENAIFHGIEGVDRKGEIKVCAYKKNNRIIFVIEDNGKGIQDNILQSIFEEDSEIVHKKLNSIGIPNIQKRIKLYFGEEYGLSIKSNNEQGTAVAMTIPAIPLENTLQES
jgi:two-component system, sensor histidine kinase YesM